MASPAFKRALDRACVTCRMVAVAYMRADVTGTTADIAPYNRAWETVDRCGNSHVWEDLAHNAVRPTGINCPLVVGPHADRMLAFDDIFYLERRPNGSRGSFHVIGLKFVESKAGSPALELYAGAAAELFHGELAQSCAPNLAGYRRG